MEEKLKLSGGGCFRYPTARRQADKVSTTVEIGNALLQRYEALERKHQREVDRFEHQVGVRCVLADSDLAQEINTPLVSSHYMNHPGQIQTSFHSLNYLLTRTYSSARSQEDRPRGKR